MIAASSSFTGRLIFLLLANLMLLLAAKLYASTPANQGFSVSYQSFSQDDFSLSGPSLYLRKNLQQDSLSIKAQLSSFSIEDEFTDQIANADTYSESQNTIALGADYYYYDASMSIFSHYTSEDTSSDSSVGIDLTQSYGNGNSYVKVGFTHGWEDDSDLGLHNKSRIVRFGNGRTIKDTWQIYGEYSFASSDGDLQNFRAARRFSNTNRVSLPSGRSDQKISLISSNDIGKNRFLKTELQLLSNDWGQSGNSIEFSLLKPRSSKFALQYHARMMSLDESKYFENDLIASTQVFSSDHRFLSAQDSRELGITGIWKLNEKDNARLSNMRVEAGYTYMKNEYATEESLSSTGGTIFVNFSADY